MPVSDMAFPDDRREEVIEYVMRKYGEDCVAQMVTFNTMAAKASVKDVARVMGEQNVGDRITRLIPSGPNVTLQKSLDSVKELTEMYKDSRVAQEIIDQALKLESAVRSTGIHAAGVIIGIVQLEGPKMTEYIKKLKPTCIEDIMAMIALYRPGPMDSIPDFIDAKHGHKKVQYLDPRLAEWLEESYGVIVYQDQVLYIGVNLAGFSWGKVNKFRKALSKKHMHEVEGYKGDFIEGCVKNGVKREVAEQLFTLILPFGGYRVTKTPAASHAC